MINVPELYTYVGCAGIHESGDDEFEEITKTCGSYILASSQHEKVRPFGADGRPRMLVINAWMAHEGRNLNGDAFVKEELKSVVEEGLFSPPYAGMIDDDHDFTARGYWYKTGFAYDEVAKAWGILATGAIWAWRYADLADRLMGEMKSRGSIDVSMSVIAGQTEISLGYPGAKGQRTKVLHNPVFFTTSLLSVPPGDKYARGRAVENPTPAKLKEIAMAANTSFDSPPLPQPADIQIQSLIFPKTHWERADICAAWANNHGYETNRVSETPGAFIIQHKDPALFVTGSFKTQCVLGVGRDEPYASDCLIKAVVGNRIVNALDENNRHV